MTEKTRAACVVGWPVEHSRSPLIHNYWIGKYGIEGEYRREAVPPEQFASFVRELRQRGYVGANVTLPHKEAVLALSEPDDRTRAVGAANTLWFDGDTLRSTNTDVEGFLANLDEAAPGWDKKLDNAVVLGAGGSACGVIFGLIERGVTTIRLVNRTLDRAAALQARFGDRIVPVAWNKRNAQLPDAGLLVNTTSLGMTGHPRLSVALEKLPKKAVVADLVYSPLLTPLLKKADVLGLRRADGLGMLLHQAVRGFALWFGVVPEVTLDVRALVEADLGGAKKK